MKICISFLLLIFFWSCKQTEQKKQHETTVDTETKPKTSDKKDIVYRDTIEFVNYNDNFDYMQLNGKKGKDEISYVNDNNDDRSFLRGDLIAILWKNDTIYIAGDGDTPEIAEWIVSAKKIKDGNVSKFRKVYGKKLKYTYPIEDSPAQSYLDHLYLLAEYYAANSKNDLMKLSIKNKEDLGYSVEKQKRDEKEYYALGFYTESEHKINTFQWLYIDPETDRIYEFDLINDKLIYFP
jgi:hypothetical protein